MRASRPFVVALAAWLALAFAAAGDAEAAGKKKKPRPKKPKVEEPAPAAEPAEAPADAGAPEAAEPAPPAPAPAAQPDKPESRGETGGAPAPRKPAADSPAEAAAASTAGDEIDVDGLRKEYEDVREKLFTSRATSSTVGDALYSARLTIHLRWGSARFFGLKRVSIRLDGATVYDDARGAIGEDDAPRFEGFVAPGKHIVTVRIEAVSKDDERVTSVIENSFSVDAPADKHTTVKAKASDGGDMGWSWKKKGRGSYQLHLDVGVSAAAGDKKAAGK